MSLLTLITFTPMLGVLAILFLPKGAKDTARTVAAAATAVPLILATKLWIDFDASTAAYQFVEKADWIKSLGVQYHMGGDGLSVPLGVLYAWGLLPHAIVVDGVGFDKLHMVRVLHD